MKKLLYSLILACNFAYAVPSTFEPVIGNALLCQDHTDPLYFREYLTEHFKQPYKTEGGAYWYKPDGVRLFGSEVEEIFVSTGTDKVDFIGVVLNAQLTEVRPRILENRGISYFPDPDDKILRSPSGSILMEYDRNKSKLFCIRYRPGS